MACHGIIFPCATKRNKRWLGGARVGMGVGVWQTNTSWDVAAESGNFPYHLSEDSSLTERSKAEASLHSQTNLVGVYCRGPLLINLQATVHYFQSWVSKVLVPPSSSFSPPPTTSTPPILPSQLVKFMPNTRLLSSCWSLSWIKDVARGEPACALVLFAIAILAPLHLSFPNVSSQIKVMIHFSLAVL